MKQVCSSGQAAPDLPGAAPRFWDIESSLTVPPQTVRSSGGFYCRRGAMLPPLQPSRERSDREIASFP
ncbi:MAG TPA: hypothetical protein V6D50_04610 [Chroococcales cyanobacterium]